MMANLMKLEPWRTVQQESVLEHPFLTVTMEQVRLPDGEVIPNWPKVYTDDYVNVLVLSEENEALILEGYKHGVGRSSWQVVGGYLQEGEDPLTAVQRELLEDTGYQTDNWLYLGSYVVDPNRHVGIGHFFCARDVKQITKPRHEDVEAVEAKWVSLEILRRALLDGRIAGASYAINVALALLVVN